MTRISPTVRRRQLGLELRRIRESLGINGEEAGQRLGWYKAKVSKIETARVSVPWSDIIELLDLYEVTDPATRDSLVTLCREARQQGWYQPYTDSLSTKSHTTYIGLEDAASALRVYQPLVVPGPFQTEAYARAIIELSGPLILDQDAVDRRVRLRMERRDLIAADGTLSIWAILDEASLHREIGGPTVMREQLSHLARIARNPKINVQVIPFKAGPHASMAGSMGIFEFPEPGSPEVAYVGTFAGVLYLERKSDIEAANLTFNHLRATALSAPASVALIKSVAQQYD
jgi:hypothetical protein